MPIRELRFAGREDWPPIRDLLAKRRRPDVEIERRVREIIQRVQQDRDAALVEYTRRFDCPGFEPARLKVAPAEIKAAASGLPREDLDILAEATANVRAFHARQAEQSWQAETGDGAILGQLVRPIERVGLYVPGGQGGETPLISSLIMNTVPARIAGVRAIAVVSPPRRDGSLNPYILATANLLGLDEIYRVGSAWAVAALACGTETIARCDMLAGPGNIYVATAKSLLRDTVGIDMLAGPSEILVLADASANPDWLAADLLSQAEHDPLASALLVTTDPALGKAVIGRLAARLKELGRCEIAAKALADFGACVLVPDLAAGLELANRVAPEHMELAVAEPWAVVEQVRHAGAIFVGQHSPEPVGDYFAGPNHVLPTLGTARFSQALSVQSFCKKSSLLAISPEYLRRHGAKIARLARLEGLEAHARSVECRIKD